MLKTDLEKVLKDSCDFVQVTPIDKTINTIVEKCRGWEYENLDDVQAAEEVAVAWSPTSLIVALSNSWCVDI